VESRWLVKVRGSGAGGDEGTADEVGWRDWRNSNNLFGQSVEDTGSQVASETGKSFHSIRTFSTPLMSF